MKYAGKSISLRHVQGIIYLLVGMLCNKFVLEAVLSADGSISSPSVNIALVILQISLISAGLLILTQRDRHLVTIGIGLLVLFVLQFWVRVLIEIPYPEKRLFKALPPVASLFQAGVQYQSQISRYEDRFREVKSMLPASGVIGYVTSSHLSAEAAKFHKGLTAYTLLPLQVVHATEPEWIIGNFPDFTQADYGDGIAGLRLVKDFGNGVLLLTRNETP